jgi:F0F1-type ATP synthase assembly protein I
LNGLILPSTAVALQQKINSNTPSSQSTNSSSNPLSLNAILIAEILLGTTLGISSPLLFYVWKKERQDILMDLKKNEILQINSSIIIGVLILLTLGYNLTHIHKSGLFTASIIVPFAASSIMIIISQPPETDEKGNIQKSQHKRLKLFPAGIMAMMVGFVYIIAAVITITLIV